MSRRGRRTKHQQCPSAHKRSNKKGAQGLFIWPLASSQSRMMEFLSDQARDSEEVVPPPLSGGTHLSRNLLLEDREQVCGQSRRAYVHIFPRTAPWHMNICRTVVVLWWDVVLLSCWWTRSGHILRVSGEPHACSGETPCMERTSEDSLAAEGLPNADGWARLQGGRRWDDPIQKACGAHEESQATAQDRAAWNMRENQFLLTVSRPKTCTRPLPDRSMMGPTPRLTLHLAAMPLYDSASCAVTAIQCCGVQKNVTCHTSDRQVQEESN